MTTQKSALRVFRKWAATIDAVLQTAPRKFSFDRYPEKSSLSSDVPVRVIGDRLNVSGTVVDKDYDRTGDDVNLERGREFFDTLTYQSEE